MGNGASVPGGFLGECSGPAFNGNDGQPVCSHPVTNRRWRFHGDYFHSRRWLGFRDLSFGKPSSPWGPGGCVCGGSQYRRYSRRGGFADHPAGWRAAVAGGLDRVGSARRRRLACRLVGCPPGASAGGWHHGVVEYPGVPADRTDVDRLRCFRGRLCRLHDLHYGAAAGAGGQQRADDLVLVHAGAGVRRYQSPMGTGAGCFQ